MKKSVSNLIGFLLLNVMMVFSSGLYAQESQATVELFAGSVDQCYNKTNSYISTISVKDFVKMKSFKLRLNFDKSEFEFDAVANANALLLSGVTATVIPDPVLGIVQFTWSNTNEVTIGNNIAGGVKLFDVKFKVLNFPNNAGDNLFDSPLTWDVANSTYYYVPDFTVGGSYQVETTRFHGGTMNVPVNYTAENFSYTVVPAFCDGGTAKITITSPVGTGMRYYFNGSLTASTSPIADAQAPSVNTVRIEDANGCYSHFFTILVESPNPLVFNSVSAQDPECNGDNGEILFEVSGGTKPYTYLVVPEVEYSTFKNVLANEPFLNTSYFNAYKSSNFQVLRSAGTYKVAVTDANGCIILFDVNNWKTATITEPAPIAFNVQFTDAACGETGSISVKNVDGGTRPYTFAVANSGTAVPASGWTVVPGTISELAANYYSVWVKDANGCVKAFSNSDGSGNVLPIQSPGGSSLSASIAWNNDVTCHGGSDGKFTVTSAGGVPPYKYAAKQSAQPAVVSAPDLNSTEWQTSSIFDKATAGTWVVWVMDKNGCIVGGEGTTIPVNEWRVLIREPSAITFTGTVSKTDATNGTANGSITVPLSGVKGGKPEFDGGGDYFFTLFKTAEDRVINTTGTFTGLAGGNYTITIKDEAGCEGATVSATILNPDLPAGTKQLNITAGNLSTVLTATEKATITNLILTGTIDARDFKTMRDEMPLLAAIDLSGVTIVAYTGTEGTSGNLVKTYHSNVIPDHAFYNGVGKKSLEKIELPANIVEIGYSSLSNTGLTFFSVPQNVKLIGEFAFYTCMELTGITLPGSLQTIGMSAFANCTKLQSIIFPKSLKSLGANSLESCFTLKTITITDSIQFIGDGFCKNCSQISAINVEKNNPYYISIDGVLFDSKQTTLIQYPPNKAGNYAVPEGVTTLAGGSFYGSHLLQGINLPNTLCRIHSGAFAGSSILSVQIPDGVIFIGGSAFQSCTKLKSINVGVDNLYYSSLNGVFFNKNRTTLIQCPGGIPGDYVIPFTVDSVGWAAFANCRDLKSVLIPSNVSAIDQFAFFGCIGLTSMILKCVPIKVPDNVLYNVNKSTCKLFVQYGLKASYLGTDLWKDFANIIEMPGFTLSKSEIAFKSTIDKTTVDLSITNGTAWHASSDSDWLKVSPPGNDNPGVLVVEATENTSSNIRTGKITITADINTEPKTITVTQAGQEQVLELTIHVQTPGTLTALLTAAQKSMVKRLTVTGVIDARDFKTMRDDLPLLEFLDLSGVTIAAYTGTEGTAGTDVISYPANAIPDYAFCRPDTLVGKTTLVSFNFPPTVTIIKDSAFGRCTGLSNIAIPSTVTSIERNTFIGCTGLSGNLNIPSLVTFVGSGAFDRCIHIGIVIVPASLVKIESNAFDANALINVSAQNPNYSSIEGVFVNKDQTTLIQFPKVKTGTYTIPSTIINIGPGAFVDCTELTAVNIPISVKTIGDESFKGCTNLKGIILPNSLTSIGFRAFYNCTGLKTFSIPASVTSIGSEAFRNCSGLESFYTYSPLPIDLSNSPGIFEGVNKTTCKLYVPYGSKAAYQGADQWKEFLYIIEMPGLKLSTNNVRLAGAQGSSVTIDLSSNTQWHISTTATWLNISPSWGEGNLKLTITADANSNQIRDATIALYVSGSTTPSQIISVVQDKDAGSIPNFVISTPYQELNLGGMLEVRVYTSQLDASSNIISYQFNLDYDHTKLQYVDKSFSGTIAQDGSVVVNANTPGRLQVSYMRSTPISGTGALIKLKFNTLTSGTSAITISHFFYNSTPCQGINNGSVTINDNTPPWAVITYSDLDGLVKPGDKLTITATFSEPMAELPVPKIILSGVNSLGATNMTRVSNTVYTYEHAVANGNGDVYVSLASGTDLFGNRVAEMPTSGRIFWIDNVRPQVLLTYSDTDLKVRAGDEIVITATFSEAMAGSSVPGISLSGVNTLATTAMTKVSSTVYTYRYTAVNGDGMVSVHLSGATDIAGNLVVSPTSGNTFQIIRFRFGDVDDNGFVQAYDAALTLQYSVGLNPLPTIDPLPWEKWRVMAADVDNSIGVTANDAAMILQYSANTISMFPSESRIKSGRIDEVDVYVSIENGSLVFRSNGNMIGLNLSVRENRQLLGMPQLVDPNMILATNISETSYAVGIATAIAPGNGAAFMKIPYTGGPNSKVTLEMIVNTTAKELTVGLATRITELGANKILVYPNPAPHTLFIKGLDGESKGSIYDLQGKFISGQNVVNGQIDIRNLKTGLYILKLETTGRIETIKFEKR